MAADPKRYNQTMQDTGPDKLKEIPLDLQKRITCI